MNTSQIIAQAKQFLLTNTGPKSIDTIAHAIGCSVLDTRKAIVDHSDFRRVPGVIGTNCWLMDLWQPHRARLDKSTKAAQAAAVDEQRRAYVRENRQPTHRVQPTDMRLRHGPTVMQTLHVHGELTYKQLYKFTKLSFYSLRSTLRLLIVEGKVNQSIRNRGELHFSEVKHVRASA